MDVSVLNDAKSPIEILTLKENFFSTNIFYSYCEQYADNNIYLKAVVDIGCLLTREHQKNEKKYTDTEYEICFSLFKGKEKNSFFKFERKELDILGAVDLSNKLMRFFLYTAMGEINKNGFASSIESSLNKKIAFFFND